MLTIDAHIDVPWIMTKRGAIDLNQRQTESAVDFPRMREGGLQSAIFALYLSDSMQNGRRAEEVDALIDAQIAFINEQMGCEIVDDPANAEAVYATGKIPIFLGLEGGRLIHESLTRLAELRKAGVRYLTLTHNASTSWADSAMDSPRHGGLSKLGRAIVQAAAELGILIDVSHASDRVCEMVCNMGVPVIASHSGCRALVNHRRNLSDDLIKRITESIGTIHIPFARKFIGDYFTVADHIDHVVQLTGSIGYVGIGSDLDGAEMVTEVQDVSKWKEVTIDALARKGYSDVSIGYIVGSNTLWMLEIQKKRVQTVT